jgi:hypothetical protein
VGQPGPQPQPAPQGGTPLPGPAGAEAAALAGPAPAPASVPVPQPATQPVGPPQPVPEHAAPPPAPVPATPAVPISSTAAELTAFRHLCPGVFDDCMLAISERIGDHGASDRQLAFRAAQTEQHSHLDGLLREMIRVNAFVDPTLTAVLLVLKAVTGRLSLP